MPVMSVSWKASEPISLLPTWPSHDFLTTINAETAEHAELVFSLRSLRSLRSSGYCSDRGRRHQPRVLGEHAGRVPRRRPFPLLQPFLNLRVAQLESETLAR